MTTTKKKKKRADKRVERRFVAQSSHNPWLVRALGAVGAMGLGAGGWAYLYGSTGQHVFAIDDKLKPIPSYLVAAGAVLTGVAIWLGTSAETPVRIGAPGIAVERGETRRMPWWAVKQVSWESGTLSLVVSGNDESGADWTFKVPLKAHPEAVAWIVKEARERVPKVLDVPEEIAEGLPEASPHAGTKIDLEPLQVVGKKCASSGKTISYEPDARACNRCERVYFKRSVPKKCKCGASLAHLRGSATEQEQEDDESEEHEEEQAEG